MVWIDNLYVSDNINKKKNKIIKKIKKGKLTANKYIIALSRSDSDLLDIFQANVLKQSYYKSQDIIVIGVASGKKQSYELVKKIFDDCIEFTGTLDIKQFIKSRMGEQ